MENILRAKFYMERLQKCPVTGEMRPQYRFCSDAHYPFSNENLRILQVEILRGRNEAVPTQLRTIDIDDFAEFETKPIQKQLFQNWIKSGFKFANILLQEFKADHYQNASEQAVANIDWFHRPGKS